MRILVCQINPTIGDFSSNVEKIKRGIAQGREEKAHLVLFPELALSGYPPDDFLLMPHFVNQATAALDAVIQASKGIWTIVGTFRRSEEGAEKGLYNSAAIIHDGKLVGFQDKSLLPSYDVFDERRYFEPARDVKVWEIAGSKVAITICEDLWQHWGKMKLTDYKFDPILAIKEQNPDLLLNLSASPFHMAKFSERIGVCKAPALTLGCPVILCNQVGGNDSLIFDGYSFAVSKKGELLCLAKGFEEQNLLIDTQNLPAPIEFKENGIHNLHDALVLGLRDYFHKSNLKKACLGLSGGIDSAVTLALAVSALGKENVLAVMLPSRFSSQASLKDAKELVANLGVESWTLSIEEPFVAFLDLLLPKFSPRPFDVTEENLQARIRGMILMAISNKLGYIVLSTGNKSELATGFATLYGDMVGGLGVLSDVTKRQVYQLARHINQKKEIIPQSILIKPPSAELREGQLDSDSLPDYEIIDNVVEGYIEKHLSPEEIAKKFGYPVEVVSDLIQRIHKNEYKRRQSAPGLRVSTKAFSVGRRFPIVQKFV
jgi:NAD+ synthase (glutamine-hydrolysing)